MPFKNSPHFIVCFHLLSVHFFFINVDRAFLSCNAPFLPLICFSSLCPINDSHPPPTHSASILHLLLSNSYSPSTVMNTDDPLSAHALIMDALQSSHAMAPLAAGPQPSSPYASASNPSRMGYDEGYYNSEQLSFEVMERMGVDRETLQRLDAIRAYLYKEVTPFPFLSTSFLSTFSQRTSLNFTDLSFYFNSELTLFPI